MQLVGHRHFVEVRENLEKGRDQGLLQCVRNEEVFPGQGPGPLAQEGSMQLEDLREQQRTNRDLGLETVAEAVQEVQVQEDIRTMLQEVGTTLFRTNAWVCSV